MKFTATLLFISAIVSCNVKLFADNDSIKSSKPHYVLEAGWNTGSVLKFDDEVKQYLHQNKQNTYFFSVGYQASEKDSSRFDYAYKFPTLSAGIGFVDAHQVRLHNVENNASYQSRLGNSICFILSFRRRLFEQGNFSADYMLENGLAYNSHSYNPYNDIDNTLIGSRFSVYVGGALFLNYRIDRFEIGLGPQVSHLSNGGTDRPNKGSNLFGLGFKARYYCDDYVSKSSRVKPSFEEWKPYLYPDISVGIGIKSLISAYERQEAKSADERTASSFSVYPTYNVSANLMYKYSFRYAVGIGADVCYAPCNNKINGIDSDTGVSLEKTCPWYLGFSAKHEASYKNLSMNIALGFYALHRTGHWEHKYEQCYYEFLGLKYRIPGANGLYAGYQVKAHLGKADQLEFKLGLELGKHSSNRTKAIN